MRIRPFCVCAILTWGFTWGTGDARAQGYPGYAPSAPYAQPAYPIPYGPPPGYGMPYGPPPGYFAPGMPMPGMPMPGMPMPGMPMPGMPIQGTPVQGMPIQGTPVVPAFPGFAPYTGSQAIPAPIAPSTPVPALPTARDAAGDAGSQSSTGGPPSGSAPSPGAAGDKGEKIAAPKAPPIPNGTPALSEPMISFINGLPPGYLQPYSGPDDDHEPGCHVPQRANCDHCWFSLSYLMGFTRPGVLPIPLVTVANAPAGGPVPAPGALGNPNTAVAFSNRLPFSMQSGFRLNFGGFLDNSGLYSLEGDLMYFIPVGIHFRDQSDLAGNPLIARPLFDVSNVLGSPGPRAIPDSSPGTFIGGTRINADTDLYGFEVNGRRWWTLGPQWRADALLGFRYLHLNESLLIQDNSANIPPNLLSFLGAPASGLETDFDSFSTRNNFYGAQIGGRLRWQQDWLFASSYFKLAMGATTQQAIINGGTTLFSGKSIMSTQGGILALPSNIGNYRRVMFGVVPEVGVNVGVNISPNLQLVGGYTFLLMNTVLRPGGQIDNHVNATSIPVSGAFASPATGATAPLFHFNGEMFWMNQLNVGLNWHY